MRFFPIDAGPVDRSLNWLNKADNLDEIAGGSALVSGVVAIAGLLMAMSMSAWFLLLMLPLVLVALISLLYVTRGYDIGGTFSGDGNLTFALEYYEKVKHDPLLNGMAKPLVKNIWNHAKESHPGWTTADECPVCGPRMNALKELVPGQASITNDDLNAVNNWIEERKKFELCE